MQLNDAWIELRCERRGARRLERSRGYDDLIGAAGAGVKRDGVAVAIAAQLEDTAAQLDGEVAGVVGEVGDDLVARRMVVGVAGERLAREAVVAGRGEEPKRVPPLAPRGGGCVGGLKDGEAAALLGEVVPDGETGLPATDDDGLVVARAAHGIWLLRIGVVVVDVMCQLSERRVGAGRCGIAMPVRMR